MIKKSAFIAVFLLVLSPAFAAEFGREDLERSLASALRDSGEYAKALDLCQKRLEENPSDLEALKLSAEIHSAQGDFDEALVTFDRLLSLKPDRRVRRQKARVLGWAQRYGESLSEYRTLLDEAEDPVVRLEQDAKIHYWNHWVLGAVDLNKRLLEADPQNDEALFQLTQLYANEGALQDARRALEDLERMNPSDRRAREGLRKAAAEVSRPKWRAGTDFFEADSVGRQSDVRRFSGWNNLEVPLDSRTRFFAGHEFGKRFFSDHPDAEEQTFGASLAYRTGPEGWAEAFYKRYWDEGFPSADTFGAAAGTRVFDRAALAFDVARERLDNSSRVLADDLYFDGYRARGLWDCTQRIKIGADFQYADYSDGNERIEPAADLLYYVSFEPSRVYLQYRALYRDFDRTEEAYFSPRAFWVHRWRANWRQYLGTREVYYGMDERYIEVAYDCFLDSLDAVTQAVLIEARWTLAPGASLGATLSSSWSTENVYHDRAFKLFFEVRF